MIIKNIFFDLDYTLWDFKTNSQKALCEVFTLLKLEELYRIKQQGFLSRYKEVNHKLWKLYEKGKLKKDTLRWKRFYDTLNYFSVSNKALAEQMGILYVELSPCQTALFDGALDVLEYFSGNYKIFIITNGFSEVQHLKIEKSGIKPFISGLITSEQAGANKPSAKIFNYALDKYNLKAEHCIIIGDDLEADIKGALKAGFSKAFWFNPENITLQDTSLSHSSFCQISNLKELLGMI